MNDSFALANFLFQYGSYVFGGIALIFAVCGIYTAVLIWRAERLHQAVKNDLAQIREQQTQTNNTLIVTSDLAIANLPQITFTQQIPEAILDAVSIIDDIFQGTTGSELWETIASQPRAARLSFARAVYRLGLCPDSKAELLGNNRRRGPSVISLLDGAEATAGSTSRDPVSLRTDIAVRKVQAYRQAGEFDQAEAASEELDYIGDHGDDRAKALAPWCRAIVCLQRGFVSKTTEARAACFGKAVEWLDGPFSEIFDKANASPATEAGSRVAAYQAVWPRLELGSIAYYYLKALAASRFVSHGLDAKQGEEDAKLIRALDLSLLFYEDTRRRLERDSLVSCIYHFCVPFLVAIRNATPAASAELPDFEKQYPGLASTPMLLDLAKDCLNTASRLATQRANGGSAGGVRFIYTEGTEKIDQVSRFMRDLEIVREALDDPSAIRRFFAGRIV